MCAFVHTSQHTYELCMFVGSHHSQTQNVYIFTKWRQGTVVITIITIWNGLKCQCEVCMFRDQYNPYHSIQLLENKYTTVEHDMVPCLLFCCTLMVDYASCFSGGMKQHSAYIDR